MTLENLLKKEACLVSNLYLNWLLSFIYAFIFIYLIPWTEIYGGEMVDIFNYVERIEYLAGGGNEAEYWGLKWVTSEPLWKQVIIFISYVADDYRFALYMVSFFTVFVYASFLIKRVEWYVAMIFLLNPMMVDLFLAQLRNVVAFSLVLIAYDIYESNREKIRLPIFILLLATLIHMSMPVFFGIYYLLHRFNQTVEDKKYYLMALATALFVALFMKYGSNLLLTLMGDRHAGYDEYIASSSISYSIAWFIIAIIVGTFANFSNEHERVFIAYAITIMGFFFFASFLNIFASRYVAVIMPVIIISISYLPKHFKQGTYLFLLAYNIYSFKYWVQLTIL